MKPGMPRTRKRLIISGNVQQAGYRVLVKSIAGSMGIVGFVRNLPDETVELVCEGEPGALKRFLKSIDRKGDAASPMDINVDSMQETLPPPEGEFRKFNVEYDGTLGPEERERNREDREERMVLGASTLNQKLDGVGKDVRDVGQKVGSMHTDMNKRFDHMADRYDLIAASLKEAIVHMDRNAEKTDKAIEKSRRETVLAVREGQKETALAVQTSRKETTLAVQKSQKETAGMLSESRREVAASNRDLARAVNFMIRKLSDRPARRKPPVKRKR